MTPVAKPDPTAVTTSCSEPSGDRRILPEVVFTGQQPGEESVEIVPDDEKDSPSP